MENLNFQEKYFGLAQTAMEGNENLIFDAPPAPTLHLPALGDSTVLSSDFFWYLRFVFSGAENFNFREKYFGLAQTAMEGNKDLISMCRLLLPF
ncbi:MAG: hypothetical protein LBJ13_00005, partial [Puniceicoccales bacterium]|nr:hypothetical protein [Puniceicoccales bacterium]